MNTIQTIKHFNDILGHLQKAYNQYNHLLLEIRKNKQVLNNYYTINIPKIWVIRSYISIYDLSKWINDLTLQIKNLKLKNYILLKYKAKNVINSYFSK